MNKQETIADIIAEMRFHGQQNIDAEKDKPEYGILTVEGRIAQNYADRLEAARKREKAAIEADALAVGGLVEASRKRELSKIVSKNGADFGQLGDTGMMREALKKVVESSAEIMERVRYKDGLAFNTANYIAAVARTALAKPPRNCGVGTAEEQFERWYAFCDRYDKDCTGCPCKSPYTTAYCFARWAQMPYEEGGAS